MSIKVLIVEDDAEKLRRISKALLGCDGIALEDIESVRDVMGAKERMSRTAFDLVVLDVVIPQRIDEEPSHDGGTKLLEEISRGRTLQTPLHIIGLTAFPEALVASIDHFSSRNVFLIAYDSRSEEWAERLQMLARHVVAAKQDMMQQPTDFRSDLGIICALPALELRALITNGWPWSQTHVTSDPSLYWTCRFPGHSNELLAYATVTSQMGNTAATVSAMKMIHTFRPRVIALVGISAGIRGMVNLGDIIIADVTWDWGGGKLGGPLGETELAAAPRQLRLDADLRSSSILLASGSARLEEIRSAWPAEAPPTPLAVHIGPLASGSAVVAATKITREIRKQQGKVLGVDMESYGLHMAAEGAPAPRPRAIVMKSVVDFADEEKDDRFQSYGAYASARTLRLWAERYL
jgi:nucleoside phosphorylase/CheY-like chemotaxis protein